jgi:Tol biopolymer transport system component
MSRTVIAVVALSGLLGACTSTTELLPHSIYYQYGSWEEAQVWRMEADGSTTVQLTYEGAGVTHYAVSPADGSLAFVSGNQLFLMDGRGQNRRLIADGTQVDEETEDYIFRGFVEAPVFSPDGRTLAYAFDGLHLYDIETGEDRHVLTNLGNLLGEPFVFAKESYYPGPWSPDGDKLLIIMGYFEAATLAVMEPGAAEPFRRLWSDGPVCCTYEWTPDSRSVLVANPTYGVHWPGLWRFDSETGEESDLVNTLPGSPRFVGWPVQLRSGDLLFFYGERFSPDEGIPQLMVRSRPDGTGRTQLRPEAFHISDALWAEDGSLVLISQFSDSDAMQVILARPDPTRLEILIDGEHIWDLQWGP